MDEQILKENNVYSVSRLNNYIKALFDHTSTLKNINIKGEIYDLKQSGPHHYFMLKDDTSSIRGVLFYSDALKLDVRVKSGDEVIINGSVSVYPQKGQYQIYAQSILLYGAGNLLLELEERKKRLASEGLFSPERKRAISLYPKSVGLISAKNSAAIQDMVVNLKRRYPLADIYVFDSLVQGEGAAKDLIRAFSLAQQYPLTTLIIGRGGGASEDLSAFNDEALIRALATSNCPIISAVGHEIDTTLVDLVSDKRASTPTGAVELASVDSREIIERINDARIHLERTMSQKFKMISLKLDNFKARPALKSPLGIYEEKEKYLQLRRQFLTREIRSRLERSEKALEVIKKQLNDRIILLIQAKHHLITNYQTTINGLNPESILERGYVVNKNSAGKIIKSVDDLKIGEKITTIYQDGETISIIENKTKSKE